MRRLTGWVAVAVLAVPGPCLALGIGDIEWHSALNQPLDASIDLFSTQGLDEQDVTVKLAPFAEYQKAGLDYPSILGSLKFDVKTRSDGVMYISATSTKSITDPFLDVLIEVDWPSGHLLREYTLLLDLPVTTDEAPAPVAGPTMSSVAAGEPQPTAPVETEITMAPAPQPRVDHMANAGVSRGPGGSLRYGMVKRGDTLWAIAESMRSDKSVSVQQVMMALLKDNPEAFYGNNINNLKAGYVLRIEDPASITAMSRDEAAREAQRQYQNWLTAKQSAGVAKRPLGQEDQTTGSAAPTTAEGARLRLVAPGEEDISKLPEQADQGGASKRVLNSGDLKSMREELSLALESSDASRQENAELQDRIAELEKQIAEMQRLLSLRDDALAVLQAQGTNAGTQQPAQGTEPGAAGQAEQTVVAAETATAAVQGDEAAPAASTTQPATEAQPAEAPKAAETKPEAKPRKPVKPAARQPAKEGFLAGLLGNLPLLGMIGGGLVVIAGAGWYVMRRRRMSGAAIEEEMLLAEEEQAQQEQEAREAGDEASADVLNDLAMADSGFEAMGAEVGEIDVLAEADVYLAYQRFDRAEELLADAINAEPGRHDLVMKLLEVYAASNNRDAFIERAEALYESGGKEDDSLWKRVVAMGRKVAPGHALFGGAAAAADIAADTELPGGDLEADLNLFDEDAGQLPDSDGDNLASEALADLDFDAADEDNLTVAGEINEGDATQGESDGLDMGNFDDETAAAGEEDKGLEFEAGLDMSLGSTAANESEEVPENTLTDDNSLEFEAGLSALAGDDDTAETATATEEVAAFNDDNGLDFDAGNDLDTGIEALTETTEDEPEPIAEAEPSGIDEELEDDIDWLSSVADEAVSDEDADSLFSSDDEIATKLDLVRAYIDMGDNGSARNILDEVIAEGNDEQKNEAQELLQRIS